MTIATAVAAGRGDVRRAVDAAANTFDSGRWSRLTPGDRANCLLKVAYLLERDAERFVKAETENTGKSIKQVRNYDMPYTIDNIRFIAGASRVLEGKAMGEYVPEGTSGIRREPMGVVGVITPWNYPLMMVVWRAFPALAAGNTVVVKPASYTPVTTNLLAELIKEAGLPDGAFNVVTGSGDDVGGELCTNSRVDAIAFTGSEEVGKTISRLSSETLKKVALELGGKAPFIVFNDANLTAAVNGAVVGGLVNNGQDCANSTRYYVHESIINEFTNRLIDELKTVRMGNPFDIETDMGPLISRSQRERVERYVDRGVKDGGRLVYGGKRPQDESLSGGFYFEPAVIRTENENSPIVKEEIFGPVFTVMPFADYDDVIARSNDVIYGLGSSVWTKDITVAMNATRDLRFGTVWVNEHVPVPSEMPWAGYKRSGHGASLSAYSIEEFTYLKHVYFDISGKETKDWYYQVHGRPPTARQ